MLVFIGESQLHYFSLLRYCNYKFLLLVKHFHFMDVHH